MCTSEDRSRRFMRGGKRVPSLFPFGRLAAVPGPSAETMQVCVWRHTRWRGDSVECTLPRALPIPSPVRAGAPVSAKGPRGHVSGNKRGGGGGTKLSDRKRKSNFRCADGVYHYLLLFFCLFLRLSLLLTVFDRIRRVNEKQRGTTTAALHSACTCHGVDLRVCVPVRARVWLSGVLGRAGLSKRMMIQYESNEKLVHTFRSRSGRWLWM